MQRIVPRLTPISPYELYVQRVNATYNGLRKQQQGYAYTPLQFGGLFGQQAISQAGLVLELTDFEVK